MKKRFKVVLLFIGLLMVLSAIWFDIFFIDSNGNSFEDNLMRAGKESDVIIVFNSGGWGTIPFERAFDFSPIINNTKEIAEKMGYKVSIVPYYRTKDDFFSKMGSLKEIFFNFPRGAEVFSEKIDKFLENNPDDKVIVAGLSNGANFVDAAMDDLGNNQKRVMAIEVGAPFWNKTFTADNRISFKNQGDILANGQMPSLIWTLIKTPFVWIGSNMTGHSASLSQAMHLSGHDYNWQDIKGELEPFIERGLSR